MSPNPMDQQQAPLYETGAAVANRYEFDPGVCVLPLAEDPPTDPALLAAWSPVVALAIHAPFRKRTATYAARKSNAPPVAPAPGDTGAFVFTGGAMSVLPTLNATQANFDWAVAAEYGYVENCVSRFQDGLVLGIAPYTLATQDDNLQAAGGSAPFPDSPGAIAAAGSDPRVGFAQAAAVTPFVQDVAQAFGLTYFYNTPSYFPGVFFNPDLFNGGPAPADAQLVGG